MEAEGSVSYDEFERWTADPVTIVVMKIVKEKLRAIEEGIGAGATLATGSIEETALQTAKNVGRIEGLKELTEIQWGE